MAKAKKKKFDGKPRMKRGLSQESVADLVAVLRAFGPTRSLLRTAVNRYLKDCGFAGATMKWDYEHKVPPRRGAFTAIPNPTIQ